MVAGLIFDRRLSSVVWDDRAVASTGEGPFMRPFTV